MEGTLERLADPKGFQLAALDLLGDGVTGEERDAEPFAGGAFDRLARVELPGAFGPDVSVRERAFADAPSARRGSRRGAFARRVSRVRASVAEGERAWLGDADDLVADERLEFDPLVGLGFANEGELYAAGQQPVEDLAGGGDLDFDGDVRVVTAEAAERVG